MKEKKLDRKIDKTRKKIAHANEKLEKLVDKKAKSVLRAAARDSEKATKPKTAARNAKSVKASTNSQAN